MKSKKDHSPAVEAANTLTARWCDVAPEVWISAVAGEAIQAVWSSSPASLPRAQEALHTGRNAGGDRLTARILLACGLLAFDNPEAAGLYFTEAITFARLVDDRGASDEKSREGRLEFRGRCLPTSGG